VSITKVKDSGRLVGWKATQGNITKIFKNRKEAEAFGRGPQRKVEAAAEPVVTQPKRTWLAWLKRG
jgi:hypothetical protein